mmetsp:Transcript_42506/g.107251  ORF Transcript_42506/g.107251 Transcript_42506/m.107251 type:complete len:275 (-) Transcript_42506:110-934(-)
MLSVKVLHVHIGSFAQHLRRMIGTQIFIQPTLKGDLGTNQRNVTVGKLKCFFKTCHCFEYNNKLEHACVGRQRTLLDVQHLNHRSTGCEQSTQMVSRQLCTPTGTAAHQLTCGCGTGEHTAQHTEAIARLCTLNAGARTGDAFARTSTLLVLARCRLLCVCVLLVVALRVVVLARCTLSRALTATHRQSSSSPPLADRYSSSFLLVAIAQCLLLTELGSTLTHVHSAQSGGSVGSLHQEGQTRILGELCNESSLVGTHVRRLHAARLSPLPDRC